MLERPIAICDTSGVRMLLVVAVLVACGPRSASNPPPNEPPLTCKQMIECDERCGDDRSCRVRCLTRGSPEGQQQLQALNTCTSSNKCADADCIAGSCATELAACRGEP